MLQRRDSVPFAMKSTSPPAQRLGAPIAALALIVASLVVFALNARNGIGIFTDSTRYMGINPWPYDAPVYHWMLMGGQALGAAFTTTATIVAIATIVANVGLIFALIQRTTGDWRYSTIGTALIAFSPQFVTLHSSAMSEAPFISFLLVTIWYALNYFETGSRRSLLLASAFLGIATLTRFPGPALGAAIAAVILFDRRLTMRQRWTDIILLASVGGTLFFIWVIGAQMTQGRSIGRELWFYGNMGKAEWWNSLRAMLAWVLPDKFGIGLRALLLACVLLFAGWQEGRQYNRFRSANAPALLEARSALLIVLALFFVFYMIFMVLSTSLEANLSLTGRYAFPAYVILVMLLTTQAHELSRTVPAERVMWVALVGLAVVVLAGHSVRTAARTGEVYKKGYGYQSDMWRKSPTAKTLRILPKGVKIYSNGPDIIGYLTDRTAAFSPHERMLRTDKPEPGNPLSKQLARIRAEAEKEPVYIVYFNNIDWRFYLASEKQLLEGLPLTLVAQPDDGKIYRVDPHSPTPQPGPADKAPEAKK